MQRFDAMLNTLSQFGLLTDAANTNVPAGGVIVHDTYGTTGASYSPEIGNPNGFYYPGYFVNSTNEDVNVIAQGVAIPMPGQRQPGGRLSAYDALAYLGRR